MSSDNLRALQREAYAALQQRLLSTAQAASAQMLQTQAGQLDLTSLRGVTAEPGTEQYLVFSLGERELAVKAELVQGVDRLGNMTPVPNLAPWVKGVVNQRGFIISVVDLRVFFGLEPLPYSPRTRLLTLQYNEMVISFVVDGVSEMLPIPTRAIIDKRTRQANVPHWLVSYAAGSVLLGARAMMVLDVAQLLFSEKMQHYQLAE